MICLLFSAVSIAGWLVLARRIHGLVFAGMAQAVPVDWRCGLVVFSCRACWN